MSREKKERGQGVSAETRRAGSEPPVHNLFRCLQVRLMQEKLVTRSEVVNILRREHLFT